MKVCRNIENGQVYLECETEAEDSAMTMVADYPNRQHLVRMTRVPAPIQPGFSTVVIEPPQNPRVGEPGLFYVLVVEVGIPSLYGPYGTAEERDENIESIRLDHDYPCDSFSLDIDVSQGHPRLVVNSD